MSYTTLELTRERYDCLTDEDRVVSFADEHGASSLAIPVVGVVTGARRQQSLADKDGSSLGLATGRQCSEHDTVRVVPRQRVPLSRSQSRCNQSRASTLNISSALHLQSGPKKRGHRLCQILTDLRTVFTERFLGKFAVKWTLKIPPHLAYVVKHNVSKTSH